MHLFRAALLRETAIYRHIRLLGAYIFPKGSVCLSHRYSDLTCKEVICISDGRRLGYVSDAVIELPAGNICAIVVPGKCRFLPFGGQREDFVIPWNCICKIGPDILLVDIKPESCRVPRPKPGFSL